MPPTLASLVHHSALKLVVRAGEDKLGVPVRWTHVSELPDPAEYMEGGELLLTTALKLDAEDPEAMRRYVRRLVEAGVVGLGFAVGVNYEDVPEALVEAARAEGLPLLEVPRRTPFIAISKAVSAALAADQYRAVTDGFAAQRELTRQTLAAGPEGLLAALAAHLDGWAALYDPSGAVVAAAPEWAWRRAARLTADVARLRERPAPASSVIDGEDRVELHSLGTGRRPRAALAVGTATAPGTAERYAVHSAIALLTLTTERSRALRAAEQRIGAAVLRMLLAGEPDHARAVAGDLYAGLLDAPFRVIVAEPGPGARVRDGEGPLEEFAEALESAGARAAEPVLVVPEGERLVVVAVDDGGVLAETVEYAAEVEADRSTEGHDLVIGLSGPAGPSTAAVGHKQAEQSLSVARRRGRAFVEHDQLASGSVLPLLADDAVRAFSDGLLRALHEHDATGRGDLVASLRAWLSRHGQWDSAAADLGVHRHTLRYRMRRVEEILGRSLDDPDVRMELWLALKATADS
ncbi:PucR family transcriptional regulator [Streptomyces acidiscabies]|uniref:PucR family transcriptional regulator n=4 Tax=Streptomyces acidiscabies TaxID=42234 RepID=A0AAP6BI28_9ACTN|nr:PucR family transcriptional regulator [Streptomyces acidiscabies]MBZ3915520.1 PucR family transcriptional regulator [Streptomyces acidiscabies]MDX2965116.1 PucR family transcriptional regulator [Streptomyces acidiscabies]MDX3022515.1 PucR family transcriptional regulator [Streptomyces acidiscabies]MDX3796139.1 PucR family transcriptional regulator [Streptomyces acidiscabies]GAQ55980.1 purine catabolism regulatory protein [Streptomyces acidiscabies]